MKLRYSIVLLFSLASISRAADEGHDLVRVADGVYAAIPKPAYKSNCNAAVILLEDGVLVVDAYNKPSAARALIAQIKTLTEKPVKYLVVTHPHYDHFQGASAFVDAKVPGFQLITSEANRDYIVARSAAQLSQRIREHPKEVEALRADMATTTDARRKGRIEELLRQAASYDVELKTLKLPLPTVTFERRMTLPDRSRTVELISLGKAHTDGDVIVYLPKERVVVTGDALHALMPNMADSYPYDWIRALDDLAKLDFDQIIPGHGGVLKGKERIETWRSYLVDLMAATAEAYAAGASFDDAVPIVKEKIAPKYAAKLPPDGLTVMFTRNVHKAYRVIGGVQ
jgi:cyclase